MYGKYKAVEPTRDKIHDNLGLVVDFTEKGKVIIDMVKYVESMIDDFPIKLNKEAKTPAAENLLDIVTGTLLDKGKAEIYHTLWQKGCFFVKGPGLIYNQLLQC